MNKIAPHADRTGDDTLAGISLDLVWERSETVLWTIAPPGVLLHNYANHCFLELPALGYRAWAFLDGGRPLSEVLRRCCDGIESPAEREQAFIETRGIIETLAANGFLTEGPQ